MAMDKDATFQDILLELMVANEALEKIEKNSSSLLPLLIDSIAERSQVTSADSTDTAAPASIISQILADIQNMTDSLEYIARPNATADKADKDSVSSEKPGNTDFNVCCDKILNQVTACVVGLNYLAGYARDSNTLLVDIRNELLGIRNQIETGQEEARKNAELQRLQDAENAREGRTGNKASSSTTGSNRNMPTLRGISGSDAIAALAASSGVVVGLVEGFVTAFRKSLNDAFSPKTIELFEKLKKRISGVLERTTTKIGNKFSSVFKGLSESESVAALKNTVNSLKKSLGPLGEEISAVAKSMAEGPAEIKAGLGEGFAEIRSVFSRMSAAIKESRLGKFAVDIMESFSSIGRAFEELTGFFRGPDGILTKLYDFLIRPFGDFFAKFSEIFPAFSKLGKAVGTLLGKLALPLTIILGILDFFKGFNEEQGDIGAKFKAGMIELVNGLIGWLVDIPKSIISWIAGALGFKEFEKELDKMNFKDSILKPIVQWVENLFATIFEWLSSITQKVAMAVLPKAVQKLLGINSGAESTGPETRKAAGKYRDKGMLENAAKMLNDPNVRQERKDDLVKNLQQNYGFSQDEINVAVKASPASQAILSGKPESGKPEQVIGVASSPDDNSMLRGNASAIRGLALNGEDTATTMTRISKEVGPTNGPVQLIEGESLPELKERVQRGWTVTPKPETRIVSPQANISTANNAGAEMAAYQNQTNELNTSAVTSNMIAPAASGPVVNSSTVNSTTVNNTNMPDRTQNFMMPAFGY